MRVRAVARQKTGRRKRSASFSRVDSLEFLTSDEFVSLNIAVKPSVGLGFLFTFVGLMVNSIVSVVIARKRKGRKWKYAIAPILSFVTTALTIQELPTKYPLYGVDPYMDAAIGFAYGFAVVSFFDKFRDWFSK